MIPWFKQSYTGTGQSVCRLHFAIRKRQLLRDAQWEGSRPFSQTIFNMFERPKPNLNYWLNYNFCARLSGASAD